MRKLYILVALVAIFGASPALATGFCNGPGNDCNEDNSTVIKDNFSPTSSSNSNANAGAQAGAHASGGDAIQGQAQGIFGSGNSSSGSSSSVGPVSNTAFGGSGGQGGDAHQGQLQGQIGINEQGQSQFGVNEQGQGQGQGQKQTGIVNDGDQKTVVRDDSEVNVDASDNSVHSIDNDFPVNTAAPVFAGNCSQGVSAQTASFGGSIATGNSVCDYIAVAGAYIAGGDREEAFRVLDKAETAADWRFFFSRVRMTITLGLL